MTRESFESLSEGRRKRTQKFCGRAVGCLASPNLAAGFLAVSSNTLVLL